jgi:hypothetical protein
VVVGRRVRDVLPDPHRRVERVLIRGAQRPPQQVNRFRDCLDRQYEQQCLGEERGDEILNVMLIPQRAATARESYRRFISDFGYRDLRDQGFDVAYSTCARRLLRPYQRLGARLLGQTAINGEDRYVLYWPLEELV